MKGEGEGEEEEGIDMQQHCDFSVTCTMYLYMSQILKINHYNIIIIQEVRLYMY